MVTVFHAASLKEKLLAPTGLVPLINFHPDHQSSTYLSGIFDFGDRSVENDIIAIVVEPITTAIKNLSKRSFIVCSLILFLLRYVHKIKIRKFMVVPVLRFHAIGSCPVFIGFLSQFKRSSINYIFVQQPVFLKRLVRIKGNKHLLFDIPIEST